MTWQNPWAWVGVALLALPILVHLLSRAPADVRQFPSLRFIEASRLPPRARTRVRDVPLLIVRLGIIAAAVAALAQPLLQTNRRASAASRIVRAIVVDTSASMQRPLIGGSGSLADSAFGVATATAASAARAVVVSTANAAYAIAGATEWLKQQHGTHELVIVSDFQQGTIDSLALSAVPSRFGVRLVRVAGTPIDSSFAVRTAGTLQLRVTPLADRTRLAMLPGAAGDSLPATSRERTFVLGAESERGDALAALRASSGALTNETWPESRFVSDLASAAASSGTDSARSVWLVFPGFPERGVLQARAGLPRTPWMSELALALETNALLREVARNAGDATAPSLATANDSTPSLDDSSRVVLVRSASGQTIVSAAQDTMTPGALLLFVNAGAGSLVSASLMRATTAAMITEQPLGEREPFTTSDEQLQRWSRAPSDSARVGNDGVESAASNSSPMDGGDSDARWFWAAALVLLGAEALMRRQAGESLGATA
jgi:hypothetical protein